MAKKKGTPGELLEEYMVKYNLNCNKLAQGIKSTPTSLRAIILGQNRITTSIALRLAKFFGTKPELWLLAQMEYDLVIAGKNKPLQKVLKGIINVKKMTV